jgi:Protein of unknown function (DUF1588)/Protein of unknown function (DUF1592)/Protein of unknown function (DUF1595)/Protein of unknown function (DUF1585)
MVRTAAPCAVGLALALAGCGKMDKNGADAAGGSESAAGAAGGSASAGGGAGTPSSTGGSSGEAAVGGQPTNECESVEGPRPAHAPLPRLSNAELNTTVRSLLPDGVSDVGIPWLPEDAGEDGTTAVPASTTVALHELAHAVALRLTTERPSVWLDGCDVAERGEEQCRDALLEPFVARAYRRPLDDEDRNELAAVFATGRQLGGDFASGARAVLEVALESPDFVYLVERGTDTRVGDVVELTSYERAARLSYFLTGAPPDDELWAAAGERRLDDEGLVDHAERLLDSPVSGQALSRFYVSRTAAGTPSEAPTLGFDAALAADVGESSRRFVEDVITRKGGTFGALLTEPSVWTNGALASYYGFPARGAAWQKVMLDPAQRSGLFTQPAFLALTSHGSGTSAVLRGMVVLERVLCNPVPADPFDSGLPPDVPLPNATERMMLELATKPRDCQDCHADLNAVGFAFGHYDAVGRWRDTDAGSPVDSSGTLYGTEARGSFSDAIELMKRIAETSQAKECFARLWLERASEAPSYSWDTCAMQRLTDRFIAGDGDIRELLVDIAKTDTFRYRYASELLRGEP